MTTKQSKSEGLYSKTFLKEFLDLYKNLPSTWNINSDVYRNRVEKNNAYQLLVNKLKEVEPKADRSLVVSKINWLRTSYRRDRARVRQGFKPQKWYYHLLTFLPKKNLKTYKHFPGDMKPDWDAHQSRFSDSFQNGGDDNDDDYEQSHIQKFDPLDVADSDDAGQAIKVENIHSFDLYNEATSTAASNKANNMLDEINKNAEQSDRYYYMTKSWAQILKSVNKDQQIFAEKLINDVLFEAQMGSLTRNTPIEFSKCLHHNQTLPHNL